MIEIEHNFDPRKFKWLWAKYVVGLNDRHHCTNSIRGHYSRKFSKLYPAFGDESRVIMNEQPWGSYRAVYICGVSIKGYSKHLNYPHNVHAAIAPKMGAEDQWTFEDWEMRIKNGLSLSIPSSAAELPDEYRALPPEYTTCRIFRWAVCNLNREPRGS